MIVQCFFFFFFLFFIASHCASLGAREFPQLAASPEHCPAQPARCLDHCSAAELVPRCRAECQALRASAEAAGHCNAGQGMRWQCNIIKTNVALGMSEALECATS
jgi:hypothetical protein